MSAIGRFQSKSRSRGGARSWLCAAATGALLLGCGNSITTGGSGVDASGGGGVDGGGDIVLDLGGAGPEPMLSFRTPVASASGVATNELAIADFNGDAKPDLVVTSDSGQGIASLLGRGDGTFKGSSAGPLGANHGVIAGDFNGDGHDDVAVADASKNAIQFYGGRGDGTFAAPVAAALGAAPGAMLARDFDGDGKPDVAVVAPGAGGIVVLTSGGKSVKTAIAQPVGFAAGDLNGDGKQDLVVAGGPARMSRLAVLLGNGDASFRAGQTIALAVYSASAVALGDLDRDGKLDAVVQGEDLSVAVAHGVGDGTFTAGGTFPTSDMKLGTPIQIAVVDLNGGGVPDIVTLNIPGTGPAFLSVLLGRGDATFGLPLSFGEFDTSTVSASALGVADFDVDGRPDLVVTGGDHVSVWMNASH